MSDTVVSEAPAGSATPGAGQGGQSSLQQVRTRPGRWRRLFRSPGAVVAMAWLLLMIVLAVFASQLAPHGPYVQDLPHAFAGPSGSHWLGTDDLARDVLSRLMYGAQISLRAAFQVVGLALLVALPIGLLAGYLGGIVDTVLMRIMDAGLSFPPLVLALAVVSVLGTGVNNASLALAAVFFPGFARLIRGQTLAVKEETFIEASRALGTRTFFIVARRVLPNVFSAVVVQVSVALGGALLAVAALSYLGLGAQLPKASWGGMLREAYDTGLFTHPWSLVPSGAAIALAVLAFNTLGDGIAAALEIRPKPPRRRRRGGPRIRSRFGITTVARAATATSVAGPSAARVELAKGAPAQIRRAGREPGVLLSVDDLTIELNTHDGPVKAVENVSLTVGEGEIVGLVGESGSGKSLTSLALMRLLPSPPASITSGSVHYDGRDLLSLSLSQMRKVRGSEIAMIFQDPMTSLNPSTRVGTQVAEVIRIHEKLDRKAAHVRAVQMLEQVGIADPAARARAYPHELSGGMRQRVMIAIALACRPRLLIADEPTTALDVTVQAQILELLRRLQREEGMAVLFITHDLGVVADLCDRVAVMYGGQIVEQATVDELFARPRHPYTEGLLRATPSAAGSASELATIPGQVPPVGSMPVGCRFHPRCGYAVEACGIEPGPAILAEDSGREHRCARADELELRGV